MLFYTDNPVWDAENSYDEAAQYHPTDYEACDECGYEPANEEIYYELPNGKCICEDCALENLVTTDKPVECYLCGDMIPAGSKCMMYKGHYFCKDCMKEMRRKVRLEYA